VVGHQQAIDDQLVQQGKHTPGPGQRGAQVGHRREAEAADEHRQPRQQPGGVSVEQLPTPSERIAHRLLPRRQVTQSFPEQAELRVEAGCDRLQR
jgi:hypothetical protein